MPNFQLERMSLEQQRGRTLVESEECGFNPDQRAAQEITQAAMDANSPVAYAYNPEDQQMYFKVDDAPPFAAPPKVAAMIIGTVELPQPFRPAP